MDKISSIAVKITDKLQAAGVNLSIKEGTLLETAAGELGDLFPKDSVSVEEMVEEVNTAADAVEDPFLTAEEIAEKEPEGLGDVYGHCIASICEPMMPVVNGIVSKIKDQVIPTVNTLFDEAYKATTDHVTEAGIRLKIVTDGSESPLWNSMIGLLSLNDAATVDGPAVDIITGIAFPEKSEEEIISDIRSVGEEHFSAIEALVEAEGVTFSEYYNYTFNVSSGKPFASMALQSLVTAMLAIRYIDEIPEGVSGGNLNDYRTMLTNLLATHATRIVDTVRLAENQKLDQRLIVLNPPADAAMSKGATIVVNGLLYEEWLEAGGSVDAIYGAYIANTGLRRGTDILEKRIELERVWTRFVGLAQSASNDRFESHFKRELSRAMYRHAEEIGVKIRDEAFDFINSWKLPLDGDNAYEYARTVITLGIFGDGDHLRIIESVDRISKAIKGIELADAVDIALVDWLVEWAVSQVTVKRG